MTRYFRLVVPVLACLVFTTSPRAQTISLEGTVRAANAPIEGVLISARRSSQPVSITVSSDTAGHFAFPTSRLPPDDYAISIRAAGFALRDPVSARVKSDAPTHLDLELTAADFAAQATDADIFQNIPGTDRQKRQLATCMSCHALQRIVNSTHTSKQFIPVLNRMMNFATETGQDEIAVRKNPRAYPAEKLQAFANWLASINMSNGMPAWRQSMKTPSLPAGSQVRAVITEYHLPRPTIEPHDILVDGDGMVWYSNGNEPFIGRLDPRTGEHREFRYPLLKPDMPAGGIDLQPDANGDLWLSLMYQGGLARFNKASEAFTLFPVQPELNNDATQQSMVMPAGAHVDGKVWTTDVGTHGILRLDVATGVYERIDAFGKGPDAASHTPYGLMADADNNLWFLDFGAQAIGHIDAKTLVATFYPTPTTASHPRRGALVGGKIYFAEFAVNKIGEFDTKTEKFREWTLPTPWTFPYDAAIDRLGFIWSGNMTNDRVVRLDPRNGKSVEYLLPRTANIRRIFIDNTTNPPSLWAGVNHGAEILKVELLE